MKQSIFISFRYILSLLNKFEVALTWDLRTLLIPSLLPVTEDEPENRITLKVSNYSQYQSVDISLLIIQNIVNFNRLFQSRPKEKCLYQNQALYHRLTIDRLHYLERHLNHCHDYY